MNYLCLHIQTAVQVVPSSSILLMYLHRPLVDQILLHDIQYYLNKTKLVVAAKDRNHSQQRMLPRVVSQNCQKCLQKLIDKRNQAEDLQQKGYLEIEAATV